MLEFLHTTLAQAVLSAAGLFLLLALAYYLLRSLRDRIGEDEPSSNELLTNLREMHEEGDISDAEFRTIKTVLGPKLQSELKDAGKEG